jgi:hypothetical protein
VRSSVGPLETEAGGGARFRTGLVVGPVRPQGERSDSSSMVIYTTQVGNARVSIRATFPAPCIGSPSRSVAGTTSESRLPLVVTHRIDMPHSAVCMSMLLPQLMLLRTSAVLCDGSPDGKGCLRLTTGRHAKSE